MATNWSSLPSVIIVDILSYLELSERLVASSTCKRWRSCMLHPQLWRDVCLDIKISSRRKSSLSDVCARFAKKVCFKFNARNPIIVKEFIELMGSSSGNFSIEGLNIRPSSFRVDWPQRMNVDGLDATIGAVEGIVCKARRLRKLALGCISDLTDQSDQLLLLLAKHQSQSLESLFLCSVKEDPDSYGLIQLPIECFSRFNNLQELGIDYDYLTNNLLLNFCNNNRQHALERIVLHVHGIEPDYEKITNQTWRHLVAANPTLSVAINMIHSLDGTMNILDILRPSMPLSHLRMFFCQHINVAGIDFISQHMSSTFTSLHIIDGMFSNGEPNAYQHTTDENPFVMLAWKCDKLKELTLIGYQIDRGDIVAISRLRSKTLKRLDIPGCCITDMVEYNWGVCYNLGRVDDDLITEVSTNLGQAWEPLEYEHIPRAVFDVKADCEDAYISLLLADQL